MERILGVNLSGWFIPEPWVTPSLYAATGASNAVEVAVDRSFARVYVSCDASRYDEVMEALASAKGRIRSLLARSLDWRVTPELDFRIDRSTDEAERITRALENVPATLAIEKDEDGYPIADAAQEAALDD